MEFVVVRPAVMLARSALTLKAGFNPSLRRIQVFPRADDKKCFQKCVPDAAMQAEPGAGGLCRSGALHPMVKRMRTKEIFLPRCDLDISLPLPVVTRKLLEIDFSLYCIHSSRFSWEEDPRWNWLLLEGVETCKSLSLNH